MPRGPHAMPQRPMAVSNIVKCWSVMAGSWLHVVSLMPGWNMGLEIIAFHPNPEGTERHPQRDLAFRQIIFLLSFRGASETSKPGIHNHDREYGFRASAKRRIPE